MREMMNSPFLPFPPYKTTMAVEAWKIRILKQDYCGLLTYKKGEPAKCDFCVIDNPYNCQFKVTTQQLLFERVFNDE